MKKIVTLSLILTLNMFFQSCLGQESSVNEKYTYKAGDLNGIGKWYMGREIAHIMGFQGIRWLERPEREKEENTKSLLQNLDIQPEDTIADIGAGSGYHVFKMVRKAKNGLVYAVDIQDEMLAELKNKKEKNKSKNIEIIKAEEKSIQLPENSVDKVLIVDVYHELSYPEEIIASVKKAMKANGKLYLIEYRGEDDSVPIKKLHKMTEAQAVKEMEAVGLRLKENINNLPWQHCMVFVKA